MISTKAEGLLCANRGVTLIEMLFATAVLGILLSIALPSFASLMERFRLESSANSLVSALALARLEAIRSGQRVTLCKGTTETGCQPGLHGWHVGWLVFTDANRNGLFDPDDHRERLIATFPGDDRLRIQGNAHVRDYISYTPQGHSRTVGGALQVGTIRLCTVGRRGGDAIEVVISRSGRARTEKIQGFDCPPL